MPGKAKAAIIGALVGAAIATLIEMWAALANNEVFFGSEHSWWILGAAVLAGAWIQIRAYEQKKGMYADRPDSEDKS